MTTARFGRRARTALVLCAGAALLSTSACSGAPEAAEEPAASTTEEAPAASDGGTGGAAGSGEDGEGQGTAGDLTRILLVTELGTDDGTGEGAPVLAADELAALLADPFGGTAECSGELTLGPGSSPVGCVGPTSADRPDPAQDWVASSVMVPGEDGFQNGTRVAVLFSTGTELPDDADDLLEEGVSLTGLGFGSVFGMEPLDADALAERTLEVLTSENAYVPVDAMADWTEVTCEDGLDFTEFETVDCTARAGEGEAWELHVAPGTFADGDQGLLVGIGGPAEA